MSDYDSWLHAKFLRYILISNGEGSSKKNINAEKFVVYFYNRHYSSTYQVVFFLIFNL